MAASYTLHTFSISHFSEKTRWMLDAAGIGYVEKPWVPFFHIAPALRLGRRRVTTVPILVTEQEAIQDSTRILLWLEQSHAPFPLLPADADLRAQVLAVEDRFDRIGAHVIRYAYQDALNDTEGIKTLWTLDASPLQRRIVHHAFPLMRVVFRQLLQLGNPKALANSEYRIAEGLDWLATQLSDGRRYLVGGRLTAADITAAALLAPIACPDEHPIYSRPDYQQGIASLRARHAQHPGILWVRGLYRAHRRAPQTQARS